MVARRAVVLTLAAAGCFAAIAGPGRSDPTADLTGAWKEERGPVVDIVQNGSRISITAPNGRVLKGDLNGTNFSVEGDFRGEEVSGAPAQVQAAVTARKLKIKFSGAVDSAGQTITGVETKPDEIKWNTNGQITVLKVGSGKPVTMTRQMVTGGSAPMAKKSLVP